MAEEDRSRGLALDLDRGDPIAFDREDEIIAVNPRSAGRRRP